MHLFLGNLLTTEEGVSSAVTIPLLQTNPDWRLASDVDSLFFIFYVYFSLLFARESIAGIRSAAIALFSFILLFAPLRGYSYVVFCS